MKQKAASVNLKSPEKAAPQTPALSWQKCSVFFTTPENCKELSMPLAAALRKYFLFVYFARYTTALESRTDYYMAYTGDMPVSGAFYRKILHPRPGRIAKVSVPAVCEGSVPHGLGFDCILAVCDKSKATGNPWELTADVFHWMSNMLGLDYCDEAKLQLYSMGRIINIFEHSIKQGTKLFAATRKQKRADRN